MSQLTLVRIPLKNGSMTAAGQWVPKNQKDHINGFVVKIEQEIGKDKWQYSFRTSEKLHLERTSDAGFDEMEQAKEAARIRMERQSSRISGVIFDEQQKPEY